MKRAWLVTVLFLSASAAHAGTAPSDIMRQLPGIPDRPAPQDCDVSRILPGDAQQAAMAAMLRAQQMTAAARPGAIDAGQARLIESLTDPETVNCSIQVLQAHESKDIAGEFRRKLSEIRAQTEGKIERECPVIGAADYRAESCVRPIWEYGMRREHAALFAYMNTAKTAFETERKGYLQCAASNEKLVQEARQANLPPQYGGIAAGIEANGWQSVALLAKRYQDLCTAAADANRELARN